MPRGKANRLHHSRLITYLLQRLITVAIFIVGLGVIWLVRCSRLLFPNTIVNLLYVFRTIDQRLCKLAMHLNELRGHLERQSHTLDAMLARTTTRDQECQSAAPSGLPSLPVLNGSKAQSTFSCNTIVDSSLSSLSLSSSSSLSSLPLAQFDTIEYSDMPIITTTTTTESILADVACATLSSIDNDHPYAMCAEDNHNQPRHYAIPLYKEEEASNNDYSNQLNTISAKLSATSIYDYHQQHYHHDGDDNDLIEDLSLLLDTPISPELASLCSSPSTSVPTSPDFNGETESIALGLAASLSAPPLPDSSLLIQLPDTWSNHHQLVTSRKEKEISATANTIFNHEMNNKTITTITTNTTNTTTMSDTNNYNITIETVAYKPVLPVATAVVPLPQPTESTSTATATAVATMEANIEEKTWSIAKGRFVPISKVHDDDNADCQNNNSQQDTMTWHDVPSLSTFWISDTLVTPDDTEMASEYLWEEPSSFYSENLDEHSSLSSSEDESTTTTIDTKADDAFEFEVTPGRGDHFVEVPLRVQLGRRLIRRKMTY